MSLCLPLLVLLAATLPLSAQSRPVADAVTLRFLAGEVADGQSKVFLQAGDAKSDAFELPTESLTKPIEISARTMVIKEDNNEVPLCSITLPAEGKSFVVLLAPEKPAGFAPFVVRDDDSSFKAGDVYLINRSDKNLVLKLGATELVLEAGTSAKSRPTQPVDNAFYEVLISERDPAGDKTVASTRWPVDTHLRSYLFFSTSAKGRTSYRAIDEFIAASDSKKGR